jgi:hypothetical protein
MSYAASVGSALAMTGYGGRGALRSTHKAGSFMADTANHRVQRHSVVDWRGTRSMCMTGRNKVRNMSMMSARLDDELNRDLLVAAARESV